MSQFQKFGLAEPILRALSSKGYDTPTPIQQNAIPALMEGRDLLGIAQTGTGKTAAFSLPSLHRLAESGTPRNPAACRMLVLSPTRELAAQIADNMSVYARFLNLSVQCVFGGLPVGKQARKLVPGCDVLVATPGRLLDLIDQRALTLRHVEIFVLDEADQMMDLGFIKPLTRIAALLPEQRQSLFFSATMPQAIAELGRRFIKNPVRVEVAPQATTAERIQQFSTMINQAEKQSLLTLSLKKGLADKSIDRTLVFTRTKHGADRVVRHLSAAGIVAAAIHGNKTQAQRTRAIEGFRSGHVPVLVATDIAARGIDIPGVSHVFNFELPNVSEQYVHRIGRTARAGAEGIAISYVAPDEVAYLRGIERLTGVKLTPVKLPEDFLAQAAQLPKASRAPAGAERAEGDPRERQRRNPRGSAPPRRDKRAQIRPVHGEGAGKPRNDRGGERQGEARNGEQRRAEPRRAEARPGEQRQGDQRRNEHRRPDQRNGEHRQGEQRHGEQRHSEHRGERRPTERQGEQRRGPGKQRFGGNGGGNNAGGNPQRRRDAAPGGR